MVKDSKIDIKGLDDLIKLESNNSTNVYRNAIDIDDNIIIYDSNKIDHNNQILINEVESELYHAFTEGPGIVVIKNGIDKNAVDKVTSVFKQILETESMTSNKKDHFGEEGKNGRIWNALQKLADADPESFVNYYSNNTIDLVSRAYLGPAYQVTSQVNLVYPGGQAQQAHRDYHLGFQSKNTNLQYPQHVHAMSSLLTLQGAVAHCDMPIESGPTMYLPFSHKWRYGYTQYRDNELQQYFNKNYVCKSLEKGDCVFFNPAVIHAAGHNTSNIQRLANLLQISSAFGRPMENVDRLKMVQNVYKSLYLASKQQDWNDHKTHCVVAACAEGFSFPTNLDQDPPEGAGLAPQSQAEFMKHAIRNNIEWNDDFNREFVNNWNKKY